MPRPCSRPSRIPLLVPAPSPLASPPCCSPSLPPRGYLRGIGRGSSLRRDLATSPLIPWGWDVLTRPGDRAGRGPPNGFLGPRFPLRFPLLLGLLYLCATRRSRGRQNGVFRISRASGRGGTVSLLPLSSSLLVLLAEVVAGDRPPPLSPPGSRLLAQTASPDLWRLPGGPAPLASDRECYGYGGVSDLGRPRRPPSLRASLRRRSWAWQALSSSTSPSSPWCSGGAGLSRRPALATWVTRGMGASLPPLVLAVLLTLGFRLRHPNYTGGGGTDGLDLAPARDHPISTSSRSWRPVRSP